MNAASPTAAHPTATAPGGTTTTDTVQPVTVLEQSQTDVTTTFVGSMTVEKNDPKSSTFGSPKYVQAMSTQEVMTLKKSLCRPIQVAYGNWAASDVVGTNLLSTTLPEVLLIQSLIQKKVDGFQGIRGSITLRLQATANPFQQGLLKLIFYPMYTEDTTASYRMAAQESWSFLPSVELNLGKETACEMRVPFTLPVAFCDLLTATPANRPQMGGLFIKVYSPLKVGPGTATVGWNLYAHWNEDDLELINPTPNIYQSGSSKSMTKSKVPSESEKKPVSISESLAAASTVADLATAVPVLSDVAGPTAWALRIGSRVASALGFNRPPIDEKPRLITEVRYPYNSTVEGPDVSMPLSQTIQPTLKIEPTLSGKTEDEMALDYFLTKFGFQQTVNIDTTLLIGQNVFTILLGPAAQTVGEIPYPKPMHILAKIFRFWRGNYRVRVKFVKTKMHTARLMFAFFPGVLTAQTLALSEYVHREIVDIASVEDLVFELPYCSPYPYLFTTSTGNQGVYGTLQCFIVNPLQAPSSVANNIDLIIETALGEGAEYFCPNGALDILPQIPTSSLKTGRNPTVGGINAADINQPQSGPSKSGLVQVSTLSDAQVTGQQTETAQLCVGEKLMSLRQLIKIPCSLASSNMTVAFTTTATGTFPAPIYYQPFSLGATDPSGANSVATRDVLGLLAPYFRFSRGGMRVRGTFGIGAVAAFSTEGNHFVAGNADSAVNLGMRGVDISGPASPWYAEYVSATEKIWKFTLPAWQTVPMVDHHYVLTTTAADTSLLGRQTCLYLRGYNYPGSLSCQIVMSRQPADDYELISFIGPPRFTTVVS